MRLYCRNEQVCVVRAFSIPNKLLPLSCVKLHKYLDIYELLFPYFERQKLLCEGATPFKHSFSLLLNQNFIFGIKKILPK